MLDSLATQIADAVGPKLAEMGDERRHGRCCPRRWTSTPNRRTTSRSSLSTPSCNDSTSARMSTNPWWFSCKRCANCRPARSCRASILAENPHEKTGLAVTGWSILRQVRDTVMKTFDLEDERLRR